MGKSLKPRIPIQKKGGEKIKRKLRATAGVLLTLLLASGAQAATVVFDKPNLKLDTETGRFAFEIMRGGPFKETLPDFEFLEPVNVPALAVLRGKEIVGNPLCSLGMLKFLQAAPGNYPANVLRVSGGDSDLSLFRLFDLSQSRLNVSDEPIPTAALLILVGLIALIAMKGRRK